MMAAGLLYAAAAVVYVAAAVLFARRMRLVAPHAAGRGHDVLLVACVLHAAALAVELAMDGAGACSAPAARPHQVVLTLVVLVAAFRRRDDLGIAGAFLAPVAAIVVGSTAVHILLPAAPATTPAVRSAPCAIAVSHIIASIAGFAAFSVAYVLAGLYSLKDARLRAHQPAPARSLLPALMTLERATYRVLTAGFLLFTVGAVIGAVGAVRHETPEGALVRYAFALLSWTSFAVVLILRWLRGWTGRRAMLLVALGFLTNVTVVLLYVFRMARL